MLIRLLIIIIFIGFGYMDFALSLKVIEFNCLEYLLMLKFVFMILEYKKLTILQWL